MLINSIDEKDDAVEKTVPAKANVVNVLRIELTVDTNASVVKDAR